MAWAATENFNDYAEDAEITAVAGQGTGWSGDWIEDIASTWTADTTGALEGKSATKNTKLRNKLQQNL